MMISGYADLAYPLYSLFQKKVRILRGKGKNQKPSGVLIYCRGAKILKNRGRKSVGINSHDAAVHGNKKTI